MAAGVYEGSTGLKVPADSLVTYTHVIYALHALSVVIGITTAASIVGAFLLGIPSIVAVIMNYLRQSAVAGSYLESHFRWQIRTFWSAVLMVLGLTIICLPLFLVLVGFALFPLGMLAVGVWVIYRVVKGWLALREQRTVG